MIVYSMFYLYCICVCSTDSAAAALLLELHMRLLAVSVVTVIQSAPTAFGSGRFIQVECFRKYVLLLCFALEISIVCIASLH